MIFNTHITGRSFRQNTCSIIIIPEHSFCVKPFFANPIIEDRFTAQGRDESWFLGFLFWHSSSLSAGSRLWAAEVLGTILPAGFVLWDNKQAAAFSTFCQRIFHSGRRFRQALDIKELIVKFEKICVFGLGYIGLPTSSTFATHGIRVIGVDINPSVIATLRNGDLHIHEPGLRTLVQAALGSGNLTIHDQPGAHPIL
jgi:hypothetical protein